MTPDAAAWVRAHAWTQYMRESYAYSGHRGTHTCACQVDPYTWCVTDRHTWCRPTPRPDYETLILDRRGMFPAWLPGPYQHPAPYPCDTDEHRQRPLAFVWLADRLCRRLCPCECHAGARPAPAPAAQTVPRTYTLAVLPGFEQLDLLTLT